MRRTVIFFSLFCAITFMLGCQASKTQPFSASVQAKKSALNSTVLGVTVGETPISVAVDTLRKQGYEMQRLSSNSYLCQQELSFGGYNWFGILIRGDDKSVCEFKFINNYDFQELEDGRRLDEIQKLIDRLYKKYSAYWVNMPDSTNTIAHFQHESKGIAIHLKYADRAYLDLSYADFPACKRVKEQASCQINSEL